jgi:hypothetical protein
MQAALNLAKKFTCHLKIRIDNKIFIELLDTNLRSLYVSIRRPDAESGIKLTYYFRLFCS